ncbi:Uncharacterised protein [Actinomyces howellii]|uniref:Uncharacterized protein n=1 Tax=Actinomyces howellii TaxID=52771 RepID=A0A3S5EGY0_9ACTO|nr:Uncharacterised protein [Actinomyces howellii]
MTAPAGTAGSRDTGTAPLPGAVAAEEPTTGTRPGRPVI